MPESLRQLLRNCIAFRRYDERSDVLLHHLTAKGNTMQEPPDAIAVSIGAKAAPRTARVSVVRAEGSVR
jgi:hypothetical protein